MAHRRSKPFSASRHRRRQTVHKWPFRPLTVERLEDRAVPALMIALSEDGGPRQTVATGADFQLGGVSFSGVVGDFVVSVVGASSTNAAGTSKLQSSTASVQNISGAAHTLAIYVTQTNYTLPTGPNLNVESGLGGSVTAGTLDLNGIFQAYADKANGAFGTADFTNGPQTAAANAATFDTGSATGAFGRLATAYSLTSVATLALSGGGNANFSSHVNVTPGQNPPTPQIQIVKLTNGTNNDTTPTPGNPVGPILQVGSPVTWTYIVTATGSQEPIKNVVVTDSVAGVNPAPVLSGGFNVGDADKDGLLDPGETWQYTASGTAVLGQYSNVGTVTGTGNVSNTPVNATNPDHYFGVNPTPPGVGSTATIGFWANKNGQAVITGLNGGPTATNLGTWLATNFPNLYGATGANLGGKTNTDVAAFFISQKNLSGLGKTYAQVLANALAIYVNDPTLNNTQSGQDLAKKYGFKVQGTGNAVYDLGPGSNVLGLTGQQTIFDIVKAIDNHSSNGIIQVDLSGVNIISDGINEKFDI
jgi:hypothetical protein